jgi:peptide/nickel transport system substrate-binding protein
MEVANDDLPYIFLEYSDDLYGVSSRVKNLVVSPYEDWTYHVYQTELVNE